MNIKIKRALSLLFCALLITLLFPSAALAAGNDPLTWDERIEQFLEDWGCDEKAITAGYYNTVTGETHFYRPDDFMDAGNMYTLPLTMVYAEKIASGEMTDETLISNVKLSTLMHDTLVQSTDYYATLLWRALGSYDDFHSCIAPYMGVDPEHIDQKFFEGRYFTPRQMLTCLQTLYSEPEHFPGITDLMEESDPADFFKSREQTVYVTHKGGSVTNGGHKYVSDCAICLTDEPILIVLFTEDVPNPNELTADFCELMITYAAETYERQLQAAEEERLAEIDRVNALDAKAAEEAQQQLMLLEHNDSVKAAHIETVSSKLMLLVYAILAVGIIAGIFLAIQEKVRAFPFILAVVFAAGGVCACILSYKYGALRYDIIGEPAECVTGFFDCVVSGDMDGAGEYLSAVSESGICETHHPAVREALAESYSYELYGDLYYNGLNAGQIVRFEYLDIEKLESALDAETVLTAEELAGTLESASVTDGSGEYLPEFLSLVSERALDSVLSHCSDYYSYSYLIISLSYSEDAWKIDPSSELLDALRGISPAGEEAETNG